MFGRISLIDHLFPLLLLDDEGEGGGGGIGDVSEIPHGQSGDVAILERGSDEDDEGDEEEEEESKERPAKKPSSKENEEEEEGEPETFSDDEEEEESEEEEDKEEGEEEDEDAEVFAGRPTLTDIKKKYPKIFKEFPELREVLFREQKMSEQFGTVEEAQESSILAQSFRTIEANLLAGDPGLIIEQLVENNPEALGKVVDNFLPTLLEKGGEGLYLRMTVPVIETFLWNVQEHGKKTGDTNLVRSAQHAANYIFGKPEIPDPNRRRGPQGPHPAEKKLEEERKAWEETRFKEASSEVSVAIDTELDSEISKGLDPGKQLTPRQRAKLIEDIKNEIDATLSKDTAFGRQMRALWQKAADASYPKDQRASIKSAFLARAKALVPSVRTRLRAEWLGDRAASSDERPAPKAREKEQPPKKRTLPDAGRSGSGGPKRPPKPEEVDYTRTSDEDLIAGKFVRRRG